MRMTSVRCPVSRADVVRVTDFEDVVTRLVCPEYDEEHATCRLKTREVSGGPLARLLERTRDGTLATHGVRCDLV
jgi:hypothetical protein